MELDEVGKLKTLNNLQSRPTVRVIMAIKAPKGECQIFEAPLYRYRGGINQTRLNNQCQAIKAFMRQHA